MFDIDFPLPNFLNYQALTNKDLPAFFLGFKIYNAWEDKEITLPKSTNPKKLLHLLDEAPCFLYGTILSNIKPQYNKLINNIYYKHIYNCNCTIDDYSNILQYYKLSFDSCYKHFTNGIYPIDLKHITELTVDNVQLSSVLCEYLQLSGQTINNAGGLNLFILTKCF